MKGKVEHTTTERAEMIWGSQKLPETEIQNFSDLFPPVSCLSFSMHPSFTLSQCYTSVTQVSCWGWWLNTEESCPLQLYQRLLRNIIEPVHLPASLS